MTFHFGDVWDLPQTDLFPFPFPKQVHPWFFSQIAKKTALTAYSHWRSPFPLIGAIWCHVLPHQQPRLSSVQVSPQYLLEESKGIVAVLLVTHLYPWGIWQNWSYPAPLWWAAVVGQPEWLWGQGHRIQIRIQIRTKVEQFLLAATYNKSGADGWWGGLFY